MVSRLFEQKWLRKDHKAMVNEIQPICRLVSSVKGRPKKGRCLFKIDKIMQLVHR